MKEKISVNKVINRGQLMVNLPVFITIIGIPALGFYLFKEEKIPKWGIGLSVIFGFVITWLIWSYMITKWRIWAFENVRNVHELKKRAIEVRLIWQDGHIFERTEIRTKKDKLKLKKLEQKFELEDFYREEYSLPKIKKINLSAKKIYLNIGIYVFLIIIVVLYFIYFKEIKYFMFSIFINVAGLYNAIKEMQKLKKNEPIIILDDKGIYLKDLGFKDWAEIENEKIIIKGYRKDSQYFFTFFLDEYYYEKEIILDSLDVNYKELQNFIRTYRIRYNKNNRNSN